MSKAITESSNSQHKRQPWHVYDELLCGRCLWSLITEGIIHDNIDIFTCNYMGHFSPHLTAPFKCNKDYPCMDKTCYRIINIFVVFMVISCWNWVAFRAMYDLWETWDCFSTRQIYFCDILVAQGYNMNRVNYFPIKSPT